MSSELGDREQQLLSLAAVGGSEHIRRVALVVENSRASLTVSFIRGEVPTYSVESLAELRAVLTNHFNDRHATGESEEPTTDSGMIAIDLTDISLDDTALFAAGLRLATRLGVLYILSPKQFDLFEEGTFDCVVR